MAQDELLAALKNLLNLVEINETNCQAYHPNWNTHMSRSENLSRLRDDSEISASDCLLRDGAILEAEAAIAKAEEVK